MWTDAAFVKYRMLLGNLKAHHVQWWCIRVCADAAWLFTAVIFSQFVFAPLPGTEPASTRDRNGVRFPFPSPSKAHMAFGIWQQYAWSDFAAWLTFLPVLKGDVDDEDDVDNDDEDQAPRGAGWEDGEGDPCPQCGRLYRTDEFW